MTTLELDRDPNLTALFARAALRGLRPTSDTTALPDVGYARVGVRTDRDHLAAYDRVCGYRLSDELPVTYPHLLVFGLQMALMTSDGFPFPLIGLVHVANRITQRRPLHADEPLVLRVRAANLRPHDRGIRFDVESEALSDGTVVWQETSTYLHRSAGDGERRRTEPEPVVTPTALLRIPADIGRRYAEVSGDHNPIHLHALTARLFGFRGAIAHGMWSMSRCLAHYEGRLPAAYTVDVRFKLPILLPATVALTATDDGFDLRDQRTGRPHLVGGFQT
jgi:acyl dehydratase